MFCLSTSGDICIPAYLSILTNTIGNSLFFRVWKLIQETHFIQETLRYQLALTITYIGIFSTIKVKKMTPTVILICHQANCALDRMTFLRCLFVVIIGEIHSNKLYFWTTEVQCAVCIVRTVYSACKWDRIVRTVVCAVMYQCPSFFEVGSIQALKDAHEIQMYEWG